MLQEYRQAIGCDIDELVNEITRLAKSISKEVKVLRRVKDSDILRRKMVLKGAKSIFEIDDVYGLRILTSSVEKAYMILHSVMNEYPSTLDHDYIANPKVNPEKPHLKRESLRMLQVILYKNKVPFEVQITTFRFNEINESFHEQYHRKRYGQVMKI